MIQVGGITAEVLDAYDEAEEHKRLAVLIDAEMKLLGQAYLEQCRLFGEVEARCVIRANRLVNLGRKPKEIAEAFGVPVKYVRRWLKRIRPSEPI